MAFCRTLTVLQNAQQWPLIQQHAHTFTNPWVSAAMQSAARPIGSNLWFGLAQGHLEMWTVGARNQTANPSIIGRSE